MKLNLLRFQAAAAGCSILLFLLGAFGAGAQTLPSGDYRCTADLGAVLLVGRYPFEVNGFPAGTLEVTVSPTGALTGTVSAFGEVQAATGAIRVRAGVVRLFFRGKSSEGRIAVSARLQGSAFVGRATIRGRTGPCRILVGGVGSIQGEYALTLASTGNGRISGGGSLKVGQTIVPVSARGGVVRGRVVLTIKGGGTFLKLRRGELSDAGFDATTWSAHGFGGLLSGRGLKVGLVP